MEPLDLPGVGVVPSRSRPESSAVGRSRLESIGVGVIWSRLELIEVDQNRSESTGTMWFNVIVIRHFI